MSTPIAIALSSVEPIGIARAFRDFGSAKRGEVWGFDMAVGDDRLVGSAAEVGQAFQPDIVPASQTSQPYIAPGSQAGKPDLRRADAASDVFSAGLSAAVIETESDQVLLAIALTAMLCMDQKLAPLPSRGATLKQRTIRHG